MSKSALPFTATLFALALAFAMPSVSRAQTAPFYLHNGDRVVMYGDSITDQRLYTVDTEAFVQTRYPHLLVSWTNSGWGGDSVKGGGGGNIDTRIERDIIPYHPTVMTVMLGMNDGGYVPFDQGKFDTYSKGYQYLLNKVSTEDPGVRYTLLQPSPWDNINFARPYLYVGGPGGYNDTLARYSIEVARIGQMIGATVVDFNTSMNTMLTKAKAIDPTNAAQIIPGQVHPSPAGHVFMASQLVKGWGMGPLVSAVAIDASSGRVTQSDNATISHISDNGTLSWNELEGSLPLPLDFTDPVTNLVLKSSDIVATLDQETLQVANLPSASYDLKIDKTDLGQFTKDQFAQGINLATLQTPMLAQSLNVLQLVHEHTDLHHTAWREIGTSLEFNDVPDWHVGVNYNVDDPDLTKAIDKAVTDIEMSNKGVVALQRTQCIPLPHVFTLTPVRP
jgi:lysophospholipase L1-like esterase